MAGIVIRKSDGMALQGTGDTVADTTSNEVIAWPDGGQADAALAAAVLDELNTIRGLLPIPLASMTLATWVGKIKAKMV